MLPFCYVRSDPAFGTVFFFVRFFLHFIKRRSNHDDRLVTDPPILPCCVDACDLQDAFTFPAVIDDVAVVVCCQDVGGDCVGGVRRGGSEGMSHFDCFCSLCLRFTIIPAPFFVHVPYPSIFFFSVPSSLAIMADKNLSFSLSFIHARESHFLELRPVLSYIALCGSLFFILRGGPRR